MIVLINLLPNIYWAYNIHHTMSFNDYKLEVKKQCEILGIKKYLELDDKFTFWGKSKQYINNIKTEIEKNEFNKLLTILKKLQSIINTTYLSNESLLISTYKQEYIELGLAIWIYFFNIHAKISFDSVIKLLSLKVIGNIILSEELKKFFAFLNMMSIS